MRKDLQEKIDDMVDKAIQNELGYQKDYITNDGWAFLEEKAAKLVLDKIIEDDLDDEELSELTQENINSYLTDIICKYEACNTSIRVDSLY